MYLTKKDLRDEEEKFFCEEEFISEKELEKWKGLDIEEVRLFIWESLETLDYFERLVLSHILENIGEKETASLIGWDISNVIFIKKMALRKLRKLYFEKYDNEAREEDVG